MSTANQILSESGLSRLWQHIEKHDCALLSAWRTKLVNCADGPAVEDSPKLSRSEKDHRSKEMRTSLLRHNYSVTKTQGVTKENFESGNYEVAENSYFVVNRFDAEDFFSKIIKLGILFCQDSVLLKPRGQEAYFYGTNHSDNPGFGKKEPAGNFKGGIERLFMARVGGRPFVFEQWDEMQMFCKWMAERNSRRVMEALKTITLP